MRRFQVSVGLFFFMVVSASSPLPFAAAAASVDMSNAWLWAANQGQFAPEVQFYAGSGQSRVWLTADALWLTQWRGGAGDDLAGIHLQLAWENARATAALTGFEPQPARLNYLKGADSAAWVQDVETFAAVRWDGLYPGLSLVVRGGKDGAALIIQARNEAALSAVQLRVVGADGLQQAGDGTWLAQMPSGLVQLPRLLDAQGVPLPLQAQGSTLILLPASTKEPRQVLMPAAAIAPPPRVVSPALTFSTFLGSSSDDSPEGGLAVDNEGNLYVAGITYSPNFPTTPGAFDTSYNHPGPGEFDGDVFLSKFSADGATLLYSTFLGGTDTDIVRDIAVDAAGAVYLGGYTYSPNFPTTPDAYSPTWNGGYGDAYVTKLNPAGSDLLFSTFLGGSVFDKIHALALNAADQVFVTGDTLSPDFPTTDGAFDQVFNTDGFSPYIDAFVAGFQPDGSDLLFSTFLGGQYNDYGYAVAVGRLGAIFIAGETRALDFPTTPQAFDSSFNGGAADGFVTKMNVNGSSLFFSTYLGGSDSDSIEDMALNAAGGVYLIGQTGSTNFPTTPGAFDAVCESCFTPDLFVTRLDLGGRQLVYSTFIGGSEGEYASQIARGAAGIIYGWARSYSPDFPITPDAFDAMLDGSADAVLFRLDMTASALTYSTYLGGSDLVVDTADGMVWRRTSAGDSLYLTGGTYSTDFPVTAGAYDTSYNGGEDVFVVRFDQPPAP